MKTVVVKLLNNTDERETTDNKLLLPSFHIVTSTALIQTKPTSNRHTTFPKNPCAPSYTQTQPCGNCVNFSLQSWPSTSMLSCGIVVRPDGKNENATGVHMGPPQTTFQHFSEWPAWELIRSCNKIQHIRFDSKNLSIINQCHVWHQQQHMTTPKILQLNMVVDQVQIVISVL